MDPVATAQNGAPKSAANRQTGSRACLGPAVFNQTSVQLQIGFLTTRCHFSISARRKASSSAGVEPMGSAPMPASCSAMAWSFSTLASACDSCVTTSGGVPAGANTAFHS